MSLISLFSDERGFLGTDQLVFSADQIQRLREAAEMASELSAAIDDQNQINDTAQTTGFNAGFELGKRQAVAEHTEEMQQTLAELHLAYQHDLAAQQAACATLAVDIVRKIAGQVAPADWLYAEATTAAAELTDQSGLVLRVHSSQLANVAERAADSNIFDRIIADETVEPNGCSIDTRYGKIDVDLDTQIERVIALLSSSGSGHD